MIEYKSKRPVFSEHDFQKYQKTFWAMPSAWGAGVTEPLLAQLWKHGGEGAISVAPVLGLRANTRQARNLYFSKQEIARLAGVNPDSVDRAQEALESLGLVRDTSVERSSGTPTTVWHLEVGRWLPLGSNGRLLPSAFRVAGSLIYGGTWSRLTGPQRAIYLAIASRATLSKGPFNAAKLLDKLRPQHRRSIDLIRCHGQTGNLRLAWVSVSDIEKISGLNRTTIQRALRPLRHRDVWGTKGAASVGLNYSPLGVYPTKDGKRLYHFRDHVEHWPWDVLNQVGSSSRIVATTAAYALPF